MKSWQNNNQINLPFDLIQLVYHTKIINPGALRTLIYLHIKRYDCRIVNENIYKELADDLNVHPKTIKNHIQQLLNVNFIGFDSKHSRIYVRSFQKILQPFKVPARWWVKVEVDNLKNFTEYIISVAIAYLIKIRRSISLRKRRAVLDCEGTLQALCLKGNKNIRGFAIPIYAISRCLNRKNSWVDKYKKKASALKLITIQHDYIETGVDAIHVLLYRKVYPENAGRIRKSSYGKILLVATDLLTSTALLVRRKKSVG